MGLLFFYCDPERPTYPWASKQTMSQKHWRLLSYDEGPGATSSTAEVNHSLCFRRAEIC